MSQKDTILHDIRLIGNISTVRREKCRVLDSKNQSCVNGMRQSKETVSNFGMHICYALIT
jgi:hypothetical protein